VRIHPVILKSHRQQTDEDGMQRQIQLSCLTASYNMTCKTRTHHQMR